MAEVELTRDGAVLTITLNRPDVLNALNRAVHAGLHAALAEARDPAVRAVVVTGAGRGFCVGQDLQEFREGAADVAGHLRSTYHVTVLGIRSLEKPVLAVVNGPAAGRGPVARPRVRRTDRLGARELRAGVQRDRARARLRRHVARAPAARPGAGVRVAVDGPQALRRRGARLGARLRGRAGGRARRPGARAGAAVRVAADACRLGDEAPPRRRRDGDVRGAARARGRDAGGADPHARLRRGRRRVSREARPRPSPARPEPTRYAGQFVSGCSQNVSPSAFASRVDPDADRLGRDLRAARRGQILPRQCALHPLHVVSEPPAEVGAAVRSRPRRATAVGAPPSARSAGGRLRRPSSPSRPGPSRARRACRSAGRN